MCGRRQKLPRGLFRQRWSAPIRGVGAPRPLAQVSLFQRDRMAAQLSRPGYLPKLLDIFRASASFSLWGKGLESCVALGMRIGGGWLRGTGTHCSL